MENVVYLIESITVLYAPLEAPISLNEISRIAKTAILVHIYI